MSSKCEKKQSVCHISEIRAGEIAVAIALSLYFNSTIFHASPGLWLQDLGTFAIPFINVTFK